MTKYQKFLASKAILDKPTGIPKHKPISEKLFPFQRDIVSWGLRRGRAAFFEACGLGKSIQQAEWCRVIVEHEKCDALILAPLRVAEQTVGEGLKIGVQINLCTSDSDVKPGINITNYEKLHRFDTSRFEAVALDESSILKSLSGATRNELIQRFSKTRFRSAWTATPAPNDFMELGNHAEFLGVMSRSEMLAMFFIHDSGDTAKWRLKGHAQDEFWKWVCSWAVNIQKPSDLGYEDAGFALPPLNIQECVVEGDCKAALGFLIPMPASSLDERRKARRGTIGARVNKVVELVNSNKEQWIVWCELNDEAADCDSLIDDAKEISGSMDDEAKSKVLGEFLRGELRVLVTKPSIAGFGLNLQRCHNAVFCGVSDSWESFFQTVRREWRYGQTEVVNCYVVTSDLEGAVVANLKRKEKDAEVMANEMIKHMAAIMKDEIKGSTREKAVHKTQTEIGSKWELNLGDCVDVTKRMADNSVGLTAFSPPFSSLYTYGNSDRDMGNSKSDAEFMTHFGFLVDELYRVTMPGRLVAFHCMNIPSMKERDGVIGIKDFRGELIRLFQSKGFIFHSEHCIWKDPLIEVTRTKAIGLQHKQLMKDSAMCRAGLPDYMIAMRKPGNNPKPVKHQNGLYEFVGENAPTGGVTSHEYWQRYASPVWMDIRQTRTVEKEMGRAHQDDKDERHICPLQLDVIERALTLWSNPDDLVYSPFTGIGSEGYCALKMGRRFIGAELKDTYFVQALATFRAIESSMEQELAL